MKTTLVSIMALPCLLVCFSSTAFSQQVSPMQREEYHPRENITGVGTNFVTYLLPSGYQVKDPDGIVSHLEQYEAIESVQVDGNTIRIQTKQVIGGNEINMIFDRLGMSFFGSKN